MSTKKKIIATVSSLFLILFAVLFIFGESKYGKKSRIEKTEPAPMHTITFLDENGEVEYSETVPHGESLEKIPESESEKGIFTEWRRTDTGERLLLETEILEDAIYSPVFVNVELLIQNALDDNGMEINDVDIDKVCRILERFGTN